MSKRTVLAIAVVLIIGLPAALRAGSMRSSEPDLAPFWTGIWGAVAVDANGKMVGVVDAGDEISYVTLHIVGYPPFRVRVDRDRLLGDEAYLYFESSDCSVKPFLPVLGTSPVGTGPRLSSPSFVDAQGRLYIGDGSTPVLHIARSRQNNLTGACFSELQNLLSVPAVEVLDLTDYFSPPYHQEGGRPLP